MKHSRRKGLSLIELVLVMVLMSMVIALCVSLISLTVKGVTSSEQILNTAMADAEFAAKVNDAIRKSTTSFTIPHDSFNEIGADGQPNLTWTKEWSYLGLLDHVTVKPGASRTGELIEDTRALVYIEWIGDRYPEPGEYDENVVNIIDRRDDNNNGVFIEHVIAHDYTDLSGVQHHYQLIFEPTDATLNAPQAITWRLTATADYGDDQGVTSFETMMQALNAVQVVYQGSAANPAVALAFRSDFKPTDGNVVVTENRVKGTICLLLDCSGSMTSGKVGGVMRMDIMKDAAKNFIRQLAVNPDLNLLIAPYGTYAYEYYTGCEIIKSSQIVTGGAVGSDWVPCLDIVNVADNEDWLIQTIESLVGYGNTNTGDGMRRIWYKLQEDAHSGASLVGNDPIMVISLSDGAMCEYTIQPTVTRTYKSNAPNWQTDIGTYFSTSYTNLNKTAPYYFPTDYSQHFFYGDNIAPNYKEIPFRYLCTNNNTYQVSPGYYLSNGTTQKHTMYSYVFHCYGIGEAAPYQRSYGYFEECASHLLQDFQFVSDDSGLPHNRLTLIAAPMFNRQGWSRSQGLEMEARGLNLQFTNSSGVPFTTAWNSGTRYFGLTYDAATTYLDAGFELCDVTLDNLTDFDRFFTEAINRITENMWAYTGPET